MTAQRALSIALATGYSGYLSSEYEGRRLPYRGLEQVRRQHAMFRALAAGG
jgi:hypothetical protein